MLARGAPIADILKGLHHALCARVLALADPLQAGAELFMSGGVALNRAMVDTLHDAVGRPLTVLPKPQLVGALGAALSVMGDQQQ